jgi:hypothetical protein
VCDVTDLGVIVVDGLKGLAPVSKVTRVDADLSREGGAASLLKIVTFLGQVTASAPVASIHFMADYFLYQVLSMLSLLSC